jgi:hypothetical protein
MKFILNKTQTFYYKRAILGLRIYTPEQIGLMTKEKKDRIRKVSKKANLIIQTLRYQKLVEKSNNVLNLFFSRGNVYDQLQSERVIFTQPDLRVALDDKLLEVTKDDIVTALLESGVLGPNFLNLK